MIPTKFTNAAAAVVITLLLILMAAAGSASQTKGAGGDKITIPLSDPSRPAYVKASLLNGSITVKAYQGKEVIVEANTRPGTDHDEDHEDDEADDEVSQKDLDRRKGMKKITNNSSSLTVEEDNNEVEIGTGWRSIGNTLDMVIQVPANSSIKLNTLNEGDITVTGVKGDIEVSNLNGNIRMTDISGSIVADALNGDIDVVFSGIETKKSMSFSSMNGEIDVTLPAASKATLKLKNDQGDIYSDFDMDLEVATEDYKGKRDPDDGKGDKKGKRGKYKISVEKVMTGSLNGGGAEMNFKNFNGNIYIRKAK